MDIDKVYDGVCEFSNRFQYLMHRPVVIVGGGPAGCATALAFHKSTEHGSFLLLDDANNAEFKVCSTTSIT